jgi:hypothetical protein
MLLKFIHSPIETALVFFHKYILAGKASRKFVTAIDTGQIFSRFVSSLIDRKNYKSDAKERTEAL